MTKAQITLKQVQAQYQDDLFDRVTESLGPRGLPRDIARIVAHINSVQSLLKDDAYSADVKRHFIDDLVNAQQDLKEAAERLQTLISATGLS